MNEIYPWGNSRRFNSYVDRLKEQFGFRVQKLTLDAGFTCPNRDGSKGYGGCTYCNNDAFNPSYCIPDKSIQQQLEEGITFHKNRYKRAKSFLAYFQAYSNTYGSIEVLKEKILSALSFSDVCGIVVGTRPDCIDMEKIAFFEFIAKTHFVSLEYGIESCYDKTLLRINRGHDFQSAVDAIKLSSGRNIHIGTHLIFGLPGESREQMLAQAGIISALPIQSIKFHQLQIIKHTAMEKEYSESPSSFQLFGLEEYMEFLIEFIEKLSPLIAIERFAGEVPPRFLVAPQWGLIRNDQFNLLLENKLKDRNTWQGRKYKQ